jgi:glycosyltransferase involved in cell wall biosynthesis
MADPVAPETAPAAAAAPDVAPDVAIVVKGYPRLSETFIAQEIHGLQERGLNFRIVSLRHPTDTATHPVHVAIAAPVDYLPEYLYQEPDRVWRGWRAARRLSGYAKARSTWLRDLARNMTPNRVRRFGQACVLAAELPETVTHLYAHFLHTPASVARYAAMMRGLTWSVSAHAKDIWTTPEWEKREKLADAAWAVTCTAIGARHLQDLAAVPERVDLLYHGLDPAGFPPPPARPPRDGSDPDDPVTLVSVGRAVPKKGYEDLIAALVLLPPELNWRFVHVGGGALKNKLRQVAALAGVSARVEWRGSQPRSEVVRALAQADLFVLASKIASDGDRDGLPNVLMEAQVMALPVVSTAVSAIPELIDDGINGRLVPPENPRALAEALADLIRNPGARLRQAAAGRARVLEEFTADAGLDRLARRFGLEPGQVADRGAADREAAARPGDRSDAA